MTLERGTADRSLPQRECECTPKTVLCADGKGHRLPYGGANAVTIRYTKGHAAVPATPSAGVR